MLEPRHYERDEMVLCPHCSKELEEIAEDNALTGDAFVGKPNYDECCWCYEWIKFTLVPEINKVLVEKRNAN